MRQIGLGTFKATPKMHHLIRQVLDTGRLSYGPLSQEFEQRFANMHGCKYGVLSNSGTSSLLVALQTLKEMHGWRDGDEVITSALTFVATVNIILQCRLKPVLVDCEPRLYGLDAKDLFYVLRKSTRDASRVRCIIPVHTFGQPAWMSDIMTTIKHYDKNIKVIEDSCEAMLVSHSGAILSPDADSDPGFRAERMDRSPVGSWGDIACFSTYIAHLLTTGVGGLATTNNPDYALYMRSLVNHGIDLEGLPSGGAYDATWFSRKFCFTKVGHSFRMTELEAALGLAGLDDLAGMVKQRQLNASYLTENLRPLEDRLQLPAIRPNTEHSFMMYPLVCRQEGVRDDLMRFLNDNGIGTRLMLPLTRQPVYNGLWNPDDYPAADYINRNGFYIGCHQDLIKDDLDYIIEKVWGFFL